jgi:hypothetical protein
VTETIEPMAVHIDQQQLAQELVDQAHAEGVQLVGGGGLLTGLTKAVVETALEQEMSDHLGYDKHDPVGRTGGNSRNGTRAKTVLTRPVPGSAEATRTPTDCCGSTSPKEPTCRSTPPQTSAPSKGASTTDPARPSAGRPRPHSSPASWHHEPATVATIDAGVDLRDVQIAARHADPRTTMRYDRARKHLDRHPNCLLAAYMASGTWRGRSHLPMSVPRCRVSWVLLVTIHSIRLSSAVRLRGVNSGDIQLSGL